MQVQTVVRAANRAFLFLTGRLRVGSAHRELRAEGHILECIPSGFDQVVGAQFIKELFRQVGWRLAQNVHFGSRLDLVDAVGAVEALIRGESDKMIGVVNNELVLSSLVKPHELASKLNMDLLRMSRILSI